MKGKAGILITVIIAAVGIKVLTILAGNYIAAADPTSSFSDIIAGFLGLADMLFYGLVALLIILIPYTLSRRKKREKNAVPDRSGSVGRK